MVYTRWGKTTCPSTSETQLLYAERAAGAFYTEKGEGSNYASVHQSSHSTPPTLLGHRLEDHICMGLSIRLLAGSYDNGPLKSFHDHNVPCAVCYISRKETVVMIPAHYTCPSSWTCEYYIRISDGKLSWSLAYSV